MDTRVQRTKAALRKSLIACMKKNAVKDIQIKEICECAGVDRSTFYKHYRNIDDIIRELEQEQLDQFRRILQTKDQFGEDLIYDVLDLINENKQINAAARERVLSDHFIDEMAQTAKEYAFDAWRKRMPKATDREVELALTITISAVFQVITKEADKYDSETIVKYINRMINGTVSMYADPFPSENTDRLQDLANRYEKRYDMVMLVDLNAGLFGTLSAKEGVRTDAGLMSFSEAILMNILPYVHESDKQKLIESLGDLNRIKTEYAIGESRDILYRSSIRSEYLWHCITLHRISEGEMLIALRLIG